MPKSNAEYQRLYRERKKLEKLNASNAAQTVKSEDVVHQVTSPEKKGQRPILHTTDVKAVTDADFEAPLYPKTDREYGLPRSNYYSDHAAPGGWAETIQKIDPHLAQRVLDRIAPPRRMR